MIIFEPNQTNNQTKAPVKIQPQAFKNCANLETVILPMYHDGTHGDNDTDSALASGYRVFEGCTKLQNIIHSVLFYSYDDMTLSEKFRRDV